MTGGDASSSNPPPPSSTFLGPGFRFHPTDEELVIYYLKRKVSGRPLLVDAIAEVDLYKAEPWDLPSRSRLPSRDVEWYFFSPLDRKYANRSRTNRATAEGYWKTTGKDRPVRHGSRIVGMKKTLVFHVGRAPRGQRTNWVMHEYRLEDEDLAGAGIAQDAYVVCRIFQKSGSGPQNGAQYGAPFVEEEWEGAEDLVPVAEDGALDVPLDAGDPHYLQLTDLEQKKDLGIQNENTPCFAAETGENDGDSYSEDLFVLFEAEHEEQSLFDDLGRDGNAPEPQDGRTLNNNIGENIGMDQQSHPDQNDGYVELRDIMDNANVDCPREITGDYLGVYNDQISGLDGSPLLPESSFMGTTNEFADPQELVHMNPPVEGDFNLQLHEFLNPLPGDYASGQPSEDDMVFYDAPSYDLPFAEDSFENMTEFQLSPVQPEFDLVDDLMAYFDATDNNIQNATLELPVKSEFVDSSTATHSNSAPEVEGGNCPAYEGTPQAPEANTDRDPPSSARLSDVHYQLERVKEEDTAASDIQMNDGWNKILRKRVVGMLGSISAPPAMARDSPAVGKSIKKVSTTHSSSSIHVTAGMIQIHDLTMMGSADHWSLQKNGGMGFLFSCDMAGDDVISKSVCFEPIAKMQSGALSTVLRNGLYLCFFSMLLLSVSFKVGISVCNK